MIILLQSVLKFWTYYYFFTLKVPLIKYLIWIAAFESTWFTCDFYTIYFFIQICLIYFFSFENLMLVCLIFIGIANSEALSWTALGDFYFGWLVGVLCGLREKENWKKKMPTLMMTFLYRVSHKNVSSKYQS